MSEIVRAESAKSWLQPSSLTEAMTLAQSLSKSQLIPKAFQGKPDECLMVLIVAQEKGLSMWETFQNLQIIEGRVGWDSKFIIQSINRSGRLRGGLQFKVENKGKFTIPKRDAVPYLPADPNNGRPYAQKAKPERPQMEVDEIEYTAWGIDATSGKEIYSQPISIRVAYNAGWVNRNPEQWIGDPENMSMLRTAKRFASRYGIGIGETTVDELRDSEPAQDVAYAEIVEQQPKTPPKTPPKKTPPPADTPKDVVTTVETIEVPEKLDQSQGEGRQVTMMAGTTPITAIIYPDGKCFDLDGLPIEDGTYTKADDPTSGWDVMDGFAQEWE